VNADMNTDPHAIRARIEAVLADLPGLAPETSEGTAVDEAGAIEAVGRRLEDAHQILVDALESVEKG
jgi:hypothetical protein